MAFVKSLEYMSGANTCLRLATPTCTSGISFSLPSSGGRSCWTFSIRRGLVFAAVNDGRFGREG